MREVLVLGAGPAGMAAAVQALDRGARVTLVDAREGLGGQYWRDAAGVGAGRPRHRRRTFAALRGRIVTDPGCRFVPGAEVWSVEDLGDGRRAVHALVGEADGARREPVCWRPDALVVATGAHDRTLPFPGWDLPGVVTAGAALAMATEGVAVGRRVLVAGAGPLLVPCAAALVRLGAEVVGVVEAASAPALVRGWRPGPSVARAALHGAGDAAALVRRRVPFRTGAAVVAAHGSRRVERARVAALDAAWAPVPGSATDVTVDAVCVTHGFTPRLELALAAGCALTPDRFVAVDGDQRTSVRDVLAAGEVTGPGGVARALAEGAVAGHCAAGGTSRDAEVRGAVRRRRTAHTLGDRLAAVHGTRPGWTGWLDDATVVCRCEDVTAGSLRAVAEATASRSLRSLRLTTRASLGLCQGRVCGHTVEELLVGARPGEPLLGDATTDRRPVAAPVRLAELAGLPAVAGPEPPAAGPPGDEPPGTAELPETRG